MKTTYVTVPVTYDETQVDPPRLVPVVLLDNGWDASYWAARHAATVAIRHHESALRSIERNAGKNAATDKAKYSHTDALRALDELMTLLATARHAAIAASADPVQEVAP